MRRGTSTTAPENLEIFSLAAGDGNLRTIKQYLRQGINVNGKPKVRHTALRAAVWSRNFDVVELLVNHGANIRYTGADGKTALDDADEFRSGVDNGHENATYYYNGRAKILEFFNTIKGETEHVYKLASKAEWDEVKKFIERERFNVRITLATNGNTLLHLAAKQGNLDAVQYLVNKGANILAQNEDGEIALACAGGNEKIQRFLQEQHNKLEKDYELNDRLFCAVIQGNFEKIKESIAEGASARAVNIQGNTILHISVRHSNTLETVEYIANLPGLDLEACDDDGKTALHYLAASRSRSDNIAIALLNAGANPFAEVNSPTLPPYYYNSYLSQCMIEEEKRITEYLAPFQQLAGNVAKLMEESKLDEVIGYITNGFGVNRVLNPEGDRLLHIAARKGNVEGVKLLLSQPGINLHAKNSRGRTALEVTENQEVINIIEKATKSSLFSLTTGQVLGGITLCLGAAASLYMLGLTTAAIMPLVITVIAAVVIQQGVDYFWQGAVVTSRDNAPSQAAGKV